MRRKVKEIILIIDMAILITLLILNLTGKQALNEIAVETAKSLVPDSITEKAKEGSDWINSIKNNEVLKEYIGEDKQDKLAEKWDSMKEEVSEYVDDYLKKQEDKLDPKYQKLIEIVRFLTTTKLKYYLIGAMVLTIVLMMINLKSLYKWIKGASWSLALSGVALLVTCYYIKNMIASFVSTENITLRMIQTPAFYLIMGGIVLRFIYGVVEIIIKINKNHKEDNEGEVS